MHHIEAPKNKTAWVILALAVGGFAIGVTEFATMSVLPLFAHGLGITAPVAGHVISAYALGVVVGAPALAVLGARLDRRDLLIALMALFVAGNTLSALAPSYHWMLVFRFISGLPHGAYFGVAALVATSLVPANRRTAVVGRVFLGLTFATIVGVPFANWLGHALGWRWSFGFAALMGAATMTCVRLWAPSTPPAAGASPLRELNALKRAQVWYTLGIGAIGFGGLFAVYTYLANVLASVTHASVGVSSLVLSVFGIGMTIGNIVVPMFADRAVMRTAGLLLVWSALTLLAFPLAAPNVWTLAADVFLIGVGGSLGTVLQIRLMDVAEDAQSLAAALNHSAFNAANALGPFLGGLAIAGGFGWTSPGWVGALLAIAGLGVWALALFAQRNADRKAARLERVPVQTHAR